MIILLYHRVADLESDPQLLAVSKKNFEVQIEHLQRKYNPVRLRDLTRCFKAGEMSAKGVAVTFDDGYADNFHNAKPILEKHGVPATFFIATDNVGTRKEFWWDELERLVLGPGILPKRLKLDVNGKIWGWDLGPAADYSAGDCRRNRRWDVSQKNDPTSRHSLYRAIYRLLRPLGAKIRDRAIGFLRKQTGATATGRESHRVLTGEEIKALARGGLMEVGSHGCSHVVLAGQSRQEQCAEVRESREILAAAAGRTIESFSYPFGGKEDVDASFPTVLREQGVTLACANVTGKITAETDKYFLPRCLVRNWGPEEFREKINAFYK